MLRLHVLASGSKGNAAIVEDAKQGKGVLIDCGICKRDFLSGCETVGFDPTGITDILITHDHSDHTKGLGVCLRGLTRMGGSATLRTSTAIREACAAIEEALEVPAFAFEPLRAGDVLALGSLHVQVFRTSHDAAESFGFRIESDDDVLGYMTDTGYVTPEAHEALQYVRILAIEANHDAQMLREGPYPYVLQQRIASEVGHLSNAQAAAELEALLTTLGGETLEHVVAMHVSQENNLYSMARDALAETLAHCGHRAAAHVARQRTPLSVG